METGHPMSEWSRALLKRPGQVVRERRVFAFLGLAGSFFISLRSWCGVLGSFHAFAPQIRPRPAEMDSGPFSRRSWATQSLRVTAKELSLSGRGRHNAIAERFSK